MELWERIRSARRLNPKMTQAALGKRVGVGQPAINSWEKQGGNKPDVEQIGQIAKALQVRPEWLAFEMGPMRLERASQPAPASGPFTEGRSIMPPLSDQDQTRLALASLAAGIVRTLEKRWPGVQKEVESELQVIYQNLRESGDGNLQTLEALRWFSESLRMK